MHRLRGKLIVATLLIHAGLLAWGASRHSFAWTEVGLLPSGLVHWKYGSFDTFRVNPPLLRMWATLPVLAMNPKLPEIAISSGPRRRAEWDLAQKFVDGNGPYAFRCLAVARWTYLPPGSSTGTKYGSRRLRILSQGGATCGTLQTCLPP
jgi:hypothetical protein